MTGTNIEKLAGSLSDQAKAQVKVQTCWVTAKTVNWTEKTMTAVGQTDGLEFYEVSLGLGAFCRRPKVGSICLIGLVENQDAAAFLLDAEEVEEFSFHGGELGGLVKAIELKAQLDKSNAVLQSIMQVLLSWVPVPSDGGAALKTAMQSALSGKTVGHFADLENEKVKH